MSGFFCIGLSHKTAPLSVRERLAMPEERQRALLEGLADASEAMVVSTCNRVEFYFHASSPDGARRSVRQAIADLAGPDSAPFLYEHEGEAALLHLFRVASSLDSMVVGEPQILGQVKDAFELAQKAGLARAELVRSCAAAFGTAKRVRTETEVGRSAISMASASVELAEKVFGGTAGRCVLIVGAGEMGALAAKHVKAKGVGRLLIANRTAERAEALAAEVGGQAVSFADLHQHLVLADVVFCSTASPTPLFTRANVAATLKARRHRPLVMVDLAVPRDVAAEVASLDGVYTYDVDDLQKVLTENTAQRALAAASAEKIVAEELARFVHSRSVRESTPVLAQLRAKAEEVARAEVAKTLAMLGDNLTEKQRKSVEAMGLAIVNKLLHQPTAKLRAVNGAPEQNRLADAAAELFGLADPQVKGEDVSPTQLAAQEPALSRGVR